MEKDINKYVVRQLNYGTPLSVIKRVLMMSYKRSPAEVAAIIKQAENNR